MSPEFLQTRHIDVRSIGSSIVRYLSQISFFTLTHALLVTLKNVLLEKRNIVV